MAPATTLGSATPVQLGGLPSLPKPKDEESDDEKATDDEGEEKSAEKSDKADDADKGTMDRKIINDAAAFIRGLAQLRGRNAEWAEKAVREAVDLTSTEAQEQQVINLVATDIDEIEFYWSGLAYIPWKNYLSIWGTIPKQSYKDSIITLKLLLHDLGFTNFEINASYDDLTQEAIEMVQAKYGVPVDGFVGPLTKIILYREKKSFDMPRLIQQ